MELIAYVVWGLASALFCGLVALVLNRFASRWRTELRLITATVSSVFPTMAITVLVLAPSGAAILGFMDLDEFLVPFALQIFIILALSAPVAWLISRQRPQSHIPTDIFE